MPFVNVSLAFKSWLQSINVQRITGAYIDGIWTNNTTEEFTIKAAVFALNAKDLKILPKGFEIESTIKLLTTQKLLSKEGQQQIGDKIYYKNLWWRVYSVFYSEMGGFYRILCVSDEK